MDRYDIVLADDHPAFRQGIKSILEGKSGLKVVGEANDGLELIDLLKKKTPRMVILDISMPNLRGIEAIHEIKKINPKMKILVLTMHNFKEYVYQAVAAGANGYVIKEATRTTILEAIDAIRKNRLYICPLGRKCMGEEWTEESLSKRNSLLTKREQTVVQLIAEGKSNKEIAEILFVSPRTVEHHRENIKKKLGIEKTADLIKYAIQKALL